MIEKEYNVLSQFCYNKNASEIRIFIYDLPVKNLEDKYKENLEIARNLRRENNNDIIVFNENLIGSLGKINNLCDIKTKSEQQRAIDISRQCERNLLERLIKRCIIYNADKEKYNKIGYNYITEKEPIYKDNITTIYKKIEFNVNVYDTGIISVNTNISSDILNSNTLEEEIKKGNIKAGDEVKDRYEGRTYYFDKVADFTIKDKNIHMNQSIIEYYKNAGKSYKIKNVKSDTKAVLVKTKDSKIFPYAPSILYKVLRIKDISCNAQKVMKQSPTTKMNDIINKAVELSWTSKILRTDENKQKHAKKIKQSMLCDAQGYEVKDLQTPKLLFGNGGILNYRYGNLMQGLTDFSPYKKKKDIVDIHYFIDTDIFKNKAILNETNKIANELEECSKKYGITLNRIKIGDKINFNNINMENETSFELWLKEKNIFYSPTIFILLEKHIEKYYNIIKKILGGRNNIAT